MTLKEYCDGIDDLGMKVIINDYMLLRKYGYTDECFLRIMARKYANLIGATFDAKWMELIAMNAMERFALRYINHPLHAEDFE